MCCDSWVRKVLGAGAPPMTKVKRKEAQHTKSGIKPQESPWKFSSIYPQNQSLPTFCFVLSPTPLTLWGGCPPLPLSQKRVNLQLQLIIPGCDSVSTYKLLWKSSSLPELVFPSTCDCSETPNCETMRCSKMSKYRFL